DTLETSETSSEQNRAQVATRHRVDLGAAGGADDDGDRTKKEDANKAEYLVMKESAQGFYKVISDVNTKDPRFKRLQEQIAVAKVILHPLLPDAFDKEIGKDAGWSIEDESLEAAIPYKAADQPAEMKGEVSLIKDQWECLMKTIMTKMHMPAWSDKHKIQAQNPGSVSDSGSGGAAHQQRGVNSRTRAINQARRMLELMQEELFEPQRLKSDGATSAADEFRLFIKVPDDHPETILKYNAIDAGADVSSDTRFFFVHELKQELEENGNENWSALGKLIVDHMKQGLMSEEEEEQENAGFVDSSGASAAMTVSSGFSEKTIE
ncbi:unnamed protein product, partial [Amoebophrya sp. A120]